MMTVEELLEGKQIKLDTNVQQNGRCLYKTNRVQCSVCEMVQK